MSNVNICARYLLQLTGTTKAAASQLPEADSASRSSAFSFPYQQSVRNRSAQGAERAQSHPSALQSSLCLWLPEAALPGVRSRAPLTAAAASGQARTRELWHAVTGTRENKFLEGRQFCYPKNISCNCSVRVICFSYSTQFKAPHRLSRLCRYFLVLAFF